VLYFTWGYAGVSFSHVPDVPDAFKQLLNRRILLLLLF
jgi:hypothetical protein